MPTYDFPVNRGRYITDFLEAWDRERRLRSDMATAEQMRQARELDLTRGRQAAEDELAARSLVPRLFAGEPRVGTARAPALPSVAGTFDTANLGTVEPGMATGQPGPGQPPVPGVAGGEDVLRAPTTRSVTEALGGPENLSTLLRTPQGQQAMQRVAPITDEEFERRQKKRQGLLEFKQHAERAQHLFEAGDTVGGLGAEAAAYRALYGAADPEKDDLTKIADKIKQRTEDIVKARKEGPGLDEETKRIAPLRIAWLKHPGDPAALAALIEGYSSVKSAFMQKQADRFVPQAMILLQRQAEKGTVDRDVAAIETEFLRLRTEGSQATGEPLSPDAAARLAVQNKPEAMPGFMRALREGKGVFPEFWSRALFGMTGVPKSDIEVAMRAVEEGGATSVAPDYWKRVGAKLGELRREKTLSPEERSARLAKWTTDKERAQALLEQTRTGKPAKPETINELSLAAQRYGKLAREWRDDFTAPKEEREEMAGRYHDMERQLLDRVEQLKGGAAPAPEGSGGPPAPRPRPGTKPPASGRRDPAALKAARDALVQGLYPGRAWAELNEEEKQALADRLSGAVQ